MVNFMIVDNDPFAVRKLAEILEMISPGQRICSFGEPETALEYGAKSQVDIAFLETRLGGMNGLLLAVRLRELQPKIQVIFVTGRPEYAVDAFRIHAAGYLLKPVQPEDVRRQLSFLYGEAGGGKRVRVQTFGGFEVFVDGSPLLFKRSKAKELLAYLVDRRGASVSNSDARTILWEDGVDSISQKSYFRTIVTELRAALKRAGAEEILVRGYNSLAIVPELLDCDSYRFLEGDLRAVSLYRHDYMPGYSWAEFSVGELERRL